MNSKTSIRDLVCLALAVVGFQFFVESVVAQSGGGWVQLFKLPGDGEVARAVVTSGNELSIEMLEGLEAGEKYPAMWLQTQGVLAVFEGRELGSLLKTAPRVRGLSVRPAGCAALYYVHLLGAGGARRSVEIYRDPADGTWIGEEAVGALTVMPARARLHGMRFAAVVATWSTYGGGYVLGQTAGDDGEHATTELGVAFEMEQPYLAGWPFMDARTLKSRTFVVGRGDEDPGTTRDLGSSNLWVRLPKDYSPNEPAGLVVWVHALPSGRVPVVFGEALDELNLICVGADQSGNERPVADRYQLALDGVATVSARYHIDRRRVYVTGLSGGGRISSMLIATVPEIFSGAIPIVGLNVYQRVPTGDGRFWPATYKKPPSKLFKMLRRHRIAAMTGPPDFNYAPTVASVKVLQRDGLDAKLFEYADMAHELPTAERFLEALNWVDEPYQTQRAKEIAEAQEYLDRYTKKNGKEKPKTEEGRRFLMRVLDAGPFTQPGWEAYYLLTSEM